jgi:hypothetical protein
VVGGVFLLFRWQNLGAKAVALNACLGFVGAGRGEFIGHPLFLPLFLSQQLLARFLAAPN